MYKTTAQSYRKIYKYLGRNILLSDIVLHLYGMQDFVVYLMQYN